MGDTESAAEREGERESERRESGRRGRVVVELALCSASCGFASAHLHTSVLAARIHDAPVVETGITVCLLCISIRSRQT